MSLITSKDFPQYSWWRHHRSQKVFVVIEEKLGFEELELKLLFEKKDEPKWKAERDLKEMLAKNQIEQLW